MLLMLRTVTETPAATSAIETGYAETRSRMEHRENRAVTTLGARDRSIEQGADRKHQQT